MTLIIGFPIGYLKINYHLKVLILIMTNFYLSYRCDNVKMLMILVLGTSLRRTYYNLMEFKKVH
jgi:hypothetical protein